MRNLAGLALPFVWTTDRRARARAHGGAECQDRQAVPGGCPADRVSSNSAGRPFDPGRNMAGKGRGDELLASDDCFLDGGNGQDRRRRVGAYTAACTGATARTAVVAYFFAVVTGRDSILCRRVAMRMRHIVCHAVVHAVRIGNLRNSLVQHRLMISVGWLMHHPATEPRYSCDALHRKGDDQ
jgi:hypothetical protein